MPRNDNLFVEIQRRWLRMPPSNRVWLSCLIALTLVMTVIALNYQQQSQRELLLTGQSFTGSELIALEGAFSKVGLSDYEILGQQVQIPRERRSEYVAALVDAQIMPTTPNAIAASPSPFESTGQRTARERAALERELSTCVRRFHDIEDASVRIDEAIMGQGFQRTKQVSSMVVVQPTESPLTSQRIRTICRLVASAKVELSETDVTVTDLSTGHCYGGTDDVALRKEEIERELSQKVESVLQYIPGLQVTTYIELRESPLTVTVVEGLQSKPLEIGSVAVSVNVPTSYYHAIWKQHRERAKHTYKGSVEETTLAAIEHETRERILQTVRPLLPTEIQGDGTEGVASVNVVSVPDLPMIASTDAPLVVGGIADWFRAHVMWSMIAVLAATVLAFFALRGVGGDLHRLWLAREEGDSLRVVKETELRAFDQQIESRRAATQQESKKQEPEMPAIVSLPEAIRPAPADSDRSLMEASTLATDDVFAAGRSAVHEELTQVVRENPDAAAEMLKQWIDKAG